MVGYGGSETPLKNEGNNMNSHSFVYKRQIPRKGLNNAAVCSLLAVAGVFALQVKAEVTLQSSQVSLEYRGAINLRDSELDLSRVSLWSKHKLRLSPQWSAQIDTLSQVAFEETGLGSTDNYTSFNRPIVDNSETRVELTRAFLMWRKRATSFVIGKQVTPWGVLDGVQVTDRFDPVRRRDFVFTDTRPERIARWGVRWRSKFDGWRVDTSFAFDGTSTQQAKVGDTFFLTSTRFTGGLSITDLGLLGQESHSRLEQVLMINTSKREHIIAHSTLGVKVGHALGEGDMSFMLYRGPDTDPVLRLATAITANAPINVSFDYLRRTVIGATYDVTQDTLVWRMELAYIPDQPLNVLAEVPLAQARSKRLLIGGGLDWSAPNNWFVNAQLVVDYLDKKQFELVRPSTDTLLTLRAQRSFFNARLLFKMELMGSVNQGDGALRPSISYDYSDNLKLQTGIDWAFGDPNGQFGQFKDASRWWASVKYTF
ncbi:hypothetical protein Patl_0960 [Paraglaciecola sp. T6c]|nr:hypothetical protein Patl_0960 [Paraglaciecola sp. T6c]